ncbi:WD repeat protein [Arthroderma uncinatum]|uniref:WD repeat protein n=1 Tax=Arthroderma uncinatum TaxID=74035 RepID=UPI00144A6E29|nr:WD repeat protein [Arthroderma uncinatum]KAF3490543.1 WD repeat protein [Arthroderma uncinatum]
MLTQLESHRYLQESGHGEAAVMLQRAWNPDPQNLPFAPYIQSHALISLVQKGLQYHDLERSIDQNGNIIPESRTPFFGPLMAKPSSPQAAGEQETTNGSVGEGPSIPSSPKTVGSRKSAPEASTNGHAQDDQTTRKTSDGGDHEEGDASINSGTPMEVDKQQDGTRSKSPKSPSRPSSPAVELVVDADGDVGMSAPPTPVYTLTNGQSVGVQIAPPKAIDLTTDTVLLDVGADNHVTKTAWRPGDSLLVGASAESYCGLWKLTGQRSSSSPGHEILTNAANVTAMEWEPAGNVLAVATYADFEGAVSLYSPQGKMTKSLPNMPGLVSGLRWSGNGDRIMFTVSDGSQSKLLMWDKEISATEYVNSHLIDGAIYEVVWSADNEVYACGDGAIYRFHVTNEIELSETFRWEEYSQEPWTLIKSARWKESSVVATVSTSTSTSNIWIPSHDIKLESAHHGIITSLEFRPHPKPQSHPQPLMNGTGKDPALILATSSMDETIKIWGIDSVSKTLNCVHRLFLGPSLAALSSTFSPDGYAIAAVSYDKLFIWNAERGGTPMATWLIPNEKTNDESSQDDANGTANGNASMLDRPLSWDSHGKKLALGFGNMIAIVNLQR